MGGHKPTPCVKIQEIKCDDKLFSSLNNGRALFCKHAIASKNVMIMIAPKIDLTFPLKLQ